MTTTSADAQRYFDQGLKFLYAFNHDEAIRSFRQAATLDPTCAMAWWGVAYACGPHINNPNVDEPHAREGSEALAKARDTRPGASPVERSLIDAVTKRYADPQPADRKPLDQAYADAMRTVWKENPGDTDVGALYAEALMDLRPWDLWTHDGQPQPGTDEVIASARGRARQRAGPPAGPAPLHPRAGGLAASRARPTPPPTGSATCSPGWPTWSTCPRTSTSAADAGRRRSRPTRKRSRPTRPIARSGPSQGFYRIYMLHNRHMLAFAAVMRGESGRAIRAIDEMIAAVPPDWARQNATLADGVLAMPLELRMRFGRWDEVLAAPEPDAIFPTARAFRHALRGAALAATGKVAEARTELEAFLEAKKRVPDTATIVVNKAVDVLGVAEHLLDRRDPLPRGEAGRGVCRPPRGRAPRGCAPLLRAPRLDHPRAARTRRRADAVGPLRRGRTGLPRRPGAPPRERLVALRPGAEPGAPG